MRLLCQRIAQRANREDEETGRFFQDRFRMTLLSDDASLLACAVYMDLNLIRATMAETLEQREHTSVQRRIEALRKEGLFAEPSREDETSRSEPIERLRSRKASFLSPLSIDELLDPIGPCVSEICQRCSDKGFLAMRRVDYMEPLDWTARHVAPGKHARKLSADCAAFGARCIVMAQLVSDFGRLFHLVAGAPKRVDAMRSHRTYCGGYHLGRRARELFATIE